MDGNGSHVTPQFKQYCRDNQIVPLYLPPHYLIYYSHSTLAAFLQLTESSKGVKDLIRLHTNHVDAVNFLTIYKDVHTQALSSSNI